MKFVKVMLLVAVTWGIVWLACRLLVRSASAARPADGTREG